MTSFMSRDGFSEESKPRQLVIITYIFCIKIVKYNKNGCKHNIIHNTEMVVNTTHNTITRQPPFKEKNIIFDLLICCYATET